MKTTLLRGYEWEFLENEDKVKIIVWVDTGEKYPLPPKTPEIVEIDCKVGTYSLVAFLNRVSRRRAILAKRRIKK